MVTTVVHGSSVLLACSRQTKQNNLYGLRKCIYLGSSCSRLPQEFANYFQTKKSLAHGSAPPNSIISISLAESWRRRGTLEKTEGPRGDCVRRGSGFATSGETGGFTTAGWAVGFASRRASTDCTSAAGRLLMGMPSGVRRGGNLMLGVRPELAVGISEGF